MGEGLVKGWSAQEGGSRSGQWANLEWAKRVVGTSKNISANECGRAMTKTYSM